MHNASSTAGPNAHYRSGPQPAAVCVKLYGLDNSLAINERLAIPFGKRNACFMIWTFPRATKFQLYNIHKLGESVLGQGGLCFDIPCKGSLMHEVERWKQNIEDHEINFNTLTQGVAANREFFPNIKYILKTLIIILISSCCCERSFSVLKRFMTWLRNSTSLNRLNNLDLLHIHRGFYVNRDNIKDVLNTFALVKKILP